MSVRGGGRVRLLAGVLLGALVMLGLAACDDIAMAGACGQGGPIDSHVKRPALIFACSAANVDGQPYYQLWRLLPHGARRLSSVPAQDPAVAPSGSRLAYESTASGMPEIDVSDLRLASPHAVATAPGGQSEPAWSRDGTRLAYVSGQLGLHTGVGVSNSFGTIFVSSAEGGGPRQVTPDDAFYGEPAWSPDGNRIAYATDRDGYWAIYTTSLTGGAKPRMLTMAGEAQWPTWSPDGTQIAYQYSRTLGGEDSIWVMGANGGGDPRYLTSGSRPTWSPDGKWIAFVRKTDQGSDLWMISPHPGAHAIRLTDDPGLKGRLTWVQ